MLPGCTDARTVLRASVRQTQLLHRRIEDVDGPIQFFNQRAAAHAL